MGRNSRQNSGGANVHVPHEPQMRYRKDLGSNEFKTGKPERDMARLARDRKRAKEGRPVNPVYVFLVVLVVLCGVAALAVFDSEGLQKQAPPSTPKGYPDKKDAQLVIDVLKEVEGCSRRSAPGDQLSMHYRGTLQGTGKEFDASYNRGEPLEFQLGAGQVIRGWDEGLKDMCEGEKRRLIIPPHLGYGERGAGGVIPGGATLVFEVELVKIQ